MDHSVTFKLPRLPSVFLGIHYTVNAISDIPEHEKIIGRGPIDLIDETLLTVLMIVGVEKDSSGEIVRTMRKYKCTCLTCDIFSICYAEFHECICDGTSRNQSCYGYIHKCTCDIKPFELIRIITDLNKAGSNCRMIIYVFVLK